jgi:hypothetical protein
MDRLEFLDSQPDVPTICERRGLARNNDLDAAGATKQPDRQITQVIAFPARYPSQNARFAEAF